MSKYAPLAAYLRNQGGPAVKLTFGDIERLIQADLPPSARKHPRWWGDSAPTDSHTWAHQWMEAGWTTDQLNLEEGWVVFRRRE